MNWLKNKLRAWLGVKDVPEFTYATLEPPDEGEAQLREWTKRNLKNQIRILFGRTQDRERENKEIIGWMEEINDKISMARSKTHATEAKLTELSSRFSWVNDFDRRLKALEEKKGRNG